MSIRKRLQDAALQGFGAAAGQAAFERVKQELFGEDEPEETPEEREARDALESKRAAEEAARAKKEAARVATERAKAKAKLEKDIDAELAALKKKLQK